MEYLNPQGWPRPHGYSNGVAASGRQVFVAGQIGWDETGTLAEGGLAAQVARALANCLAVLAEAGGGPEHVTRMTWFVVDKADYAAQRAEIGAAYRAAHGRGVPRDEPVRGRPARTGRAGRDRSDCGRARMTALVLVGASTGRSESAS